jgi:pyruvate dehydrogenase E2 component (dihydrolipoamide acetyltransferase)
MAAPITAVTMPKWGIEMTEGTITGWRIAEGQWVERGSEILDVETEKIVNAVEAPGSGVLRKILANEGETHSVGALIGIIAEDAASDADIASFVKSFVAAVVSFDHDAAPATAPAAGAVSAEPALIAAANPPSSAGEEAHVSPIARRIAERLNVDLAQVKGTGRNGRVSKEDVEAFAALRGAAASAGGGTVADAASAGIGTVADAAHGADAAAAGNAVKRVRMSARRGVIARRLLESKQSIPHYRLAVDVDFGPLRHKRREGAHAGGEAASLNDWLLRAVALSLVQHPDVNAQLEGEEILQFENADIAIAVASEVGLVTPILRAANLKSVATIAQESRDLIERARAGTLRREEITGGSFTVSNLGMYGVKSFDAIINPPQVAILAVGSIEKRAVVRGDELTIAEMGTLTLSADHRVVDGAIGAAFLKTLVKLMEHPDGLAT